MRARLLRLLYQSGSRRGGLGGLLAPRPKVQVTSARNYISNEFIINSEFQGLSYELLDWNKKQLFV